LAQVVLHDLREDSPTAHQTQVLYTGVRNPLVLCIPEFVAHGYRVLGNEPAGLFYHTTECYDPANPDEERIPFDDPRIGFNWQTRPR
jgi:dTDP-4-dehydrorhamnose 3,5-epimerase